MRESSGFPAGGPSALKTDQTVKLLIKQEVGVTCKKKIATMMIRGMEKFSEHFHKFGNGLIHNSFQLPIQLS